MASVRGVGTGLFSAMAERASRRSEVVALRWRLVGPR